MVWYSHLFQNFPQFIVIHTVKGFGIINNTEIDVFFWNELAFLMIQQHIKKQRHYFANKDPSSQSNDFSSSHAWMGKFDYKES